MNLFSILLKKEFIQELRSKEVAVVMFSLAMLLSVLASLGVQFAFLSASEILKVAPVLIWLSFVYAATSAMSRSYDYELQHGAIDGLKLAGVHFALVYSAKVCASGLVVFLAHIVATVIFLVLLDIQLPQLWPYFIVLSLIVSVGYAALAVLFAAVAAVSKLRGLILPLILFPLLFPLFIAALETTNQILFDSTFAPGGFWFGFSALLAVIYLALGVNLYQYVVEE